MGIFSRKGSKAPDPDKREVGFGVLEIYPYLFSSAEDFFKELKKECLEYLTDEEEEAIVEHFTRDRRSFRALVPKDEYERVRKAMVGINANKGESAFKHFVVHCGGDVRTSWCGCGGWSRGCCHGPIMSDDAHEAFARRKMEKDDPRLKDYFILSHIRKVQEQWESRQAFRNSYDAIEVME